MATIQWTEQVASLSNARTLHGVLAERAQLAGTRQAYTFLGKDADVPMTFGELDQRARSIAAMLQQRYEPGTRAILVFPAGIDFIAAFFGCLYAGIRAVPTTYPKPRRPMPRMASIVRDCEPQLALTDGETLSTIGESIAASNLPQIDWVDVNEASDAEGLSPVDVATDDIAFLQYTSGSTSEPKGVMVSHGNLLHNLEMIRHGFGLSSFEPDRLSDTGVFWLPAYHDMGLIGGLLESLYVGGHSVLMSPAAFLQRPTSWLEKMSEYKATISGAPNFAYELVVNRTTDEQREQLDLSNWKVAFCGAEPIRPETLEYFANSFASCGFSNSSFYPCFGLAEGTLLASGTVGPKPLDVHVISRSALEQHQVEIVEDATSSDAQRLITCGGTLLDQEIVIVDPQTCLPRPDRTVGEVWVKGPSIAQGYWNRPEDTAKTFQAHLADSNHGPFLRTGDLGFLIDEKLVVTGRVKDVLIIRGRNYYPQDVEQTVGNAHEALRQDSGAVFTVEREGQEQVVVVHEIDRNYRKTDFEEVVNAVRQAVATGHELDVYGVALIRHMSLARTTSGKAQRHFCKKQFEAGELKSHQIWTRDLAEKPADSTPRPDRFERPAEAMTPEEVSRFADRIEKWMLQWLMERAAVPEEEVNRDKPFAEFGLDSLTAVELSQELEDWVGVEVVPTIAWNYPTPAALSNYLARQAAGVDEPEVAAKQPAVDEDLEKLLNEIESMSDEEAKRTLEAEGNS
jgi:acyl-CoA synthetase (AMP-forming)/AMP-acid ligase II/acyl carrier protein